MTLENWASIAEIIAAVAVIASLIYVAKQLRQNTDALVAQSRQSLLTGSHSELSFEIDNPEMVTSILAQDEPPPEQQVKLHAWMCMVFRAREYAWLQYRSGVIDESLWNTEVAVMLFFFDSQRIRSWWKGVGRVAFGEEFAKFVDRLIETQPPTETLLEKAASWANA